MKKIFFLLTFFLLNTHFGYSQNSNDTENKKNPFWDKVQFGGGINMGFGNNVTNIGISPSAIYNFDDQFSAGLGVAYLYSKHKDFDAFNVYGGSLIGLYNPIKEFQLSAEFEESIISKTGLSNRNVEALYLGAGYTIGRNIAIGMRYDVLYDKDKSIYGSALSPIVRVYF